MTQDEIIEMAREAGLAHFYDSEDHCTGITDAKLITADKEKNDARLVEMLMPFANLVAAKATEEANARANASWELMCKKMVAIEREACAKVCAPYDDDPLVFVSIDIAKAIRARGEA